MIKMKYILLNEILSFVWLLIIEDDIYSLNDINYNLSLNHELNEYEMVSLDVLDHNENFLLQNHNNKPHDRMYDFCSVPWFKLCRLCFMKLFI